MIVKADNGQLGAFGWHA